MKNLMKKIRKSNKGFTLVELIIVVAIIAVLAAVAVPQYIQYVEKSRIGADESYISEVGHNIEIIAATNPAVNGQDITVGIASTGVITVSGTSDGQTLTDAQKAANAVQAELNDLFPEATAMVSNYYKNATVGITYTAAHVDNGNNVPAALAYSGCKNLS